MSPLLPVFTFISLASCAPSFVETDSIVFPKDNATSQTELSDKIKQCLNDDFKIEYNGECHRLLTTAGVCPEGQWLVLDYNSASLPNPKIVGKCVQRRCSSMREHYWVSTKRCVEANETSVLCPQGTVLSTDMFGDGYCKCIEKPVHARAIDGKCYPVFKQGPCQSGSVWVEVNDRSECQVDNCQAMRQEFSGKTIVPWRDHKCYFVNDRGPCKQGQVVLIHPWFKGPHCGDSFATLNLVNPPCLGTDHSGKCTGPVKTPDQHFSTTLANQVHSKRHRKSS